MFQQQHIAHVLALHPQAVLACKLGFCYVYSEEAITTTPPMVYFLEANNTYTSTDKIRLSLSKPIDSQNAVVFISMSVIDSPTIHANTKDAYKSMSACFIPSQTTDN